MISKVRIVNFRRFEDFTFDCNVGLNILVGDNEAGKSTILEAIHLALTRKLNGRPLDVELSPHLFNKAAVDRYLVAVHAGEKPALPKIEIELSLTDHDEVQRLRGTNNANQVDCPGVRLEIGFDEEYRDEYENLVSDPAQVRTVPIEYYRVSWTSFADAAITARTIGVRTSFIDATSIRLQSGTDYYLSGIINNGLETKDRVGLSLAYRRLKEHFADEPAIREINERLAANHGAITDRSLTVAIDLSHRSAWETSLTPHLDEVPYSFAGKGEQHKIKILLALDRRVDSTHVVLIEEPENHLSHSSLNLLLARIRERCEGKQIFATTHSAFVLNKLGIGHLVLLHDSRTTALTDLSDTTQDYFRKLPGYDTLRLVLAKRALLVEGPSDELFVQKAYKLTHGRLPIEDGVDVISVRGLSFKRFLEIADRLRLRVDVVTDNDGDFARKVEAKYREYQDHPTIGIHASQDDSLVTLEDHVAALNLSSLNTLLGRSDTSPQELATFMKAGKTEWALRVLEADLPIAIPDYIRHAVS